MYVVYIYIYFVYILYFLHTLFNIDFIDSKYYCLDFHVQITIPWVESLFTFYFEKLFGTSFCSFHDLLCLTVLIMFYNISQLN